MLCCFYDTSLRRTSNSIDQWLKIDGRNRHDTDRAIGIKRHINYKGSRSDGDAQRHLSEQRHVIPAQDLGRHVKTALDVAIDALEHALRVFPSNNLQLAVNCI